MNIDELMVRINVLTKLLEELKRDISRHYQDGHPYALHAREHEGRDSTPFVRVPIYTERPSYVPNGRLYYRSDNNTLEIQINGTIRTSTFT